MNTYIDFVNRFKSIPNAVLLATDIAARGLDIPSVDHVIHFQIPRTADTYVHRNGRTARANRKGFSMLMCAPDERRVVKALMSSLGRGSFIRSSVLSFWSILNSELTNELTNERVFFVCFFL
jgi:superfamily II DNA/RNA helicase